MTDAEHDAVLEEALRKLEHDTAADLAAWAGAERAHVEEAAAGASDAEREQAVGTFQGLAGRPGHSATGWRAPLAAAAALLLGLAGGWFGRGALQRAPETGGSVLLGPEAGRALAPVGVVDRYDRFEWSAASSGTELYGLRVWSGDGLEPVLRIDGLTEPRYVPSAAEVARLGPAIRWEVWLQDADGGSFAHATSASASLRSP